MFCPKCRAEFREGFTFCQSCNENLVDELPPKPKIDKEGNLSAIKAARSTFRVEKWLKIGGIIYIFIALPSEIANLFVRMNLGPPFGLQDLGRGGIIIHVVNFATSFLGSVLWGAFFYGLGRIIEVLQGVFSNEKA